MASVVRRELTDYQHRCVETIIAQVGEYLAQRHAMTVRANARFRTIWPDLEWQMVQQLRNTLENDKMWGPKRFVIGELLCGDDKSKVRDIFSPTHQASIQTEVVEKRDEAKAKTSEVMEIHDFRTLYGYIDPAIATAATLMQMFIWWDLADASDCAKFQIKMERIENIERGQAPAWTEYYNEILRKPEGMPNAEDMILYELNELRQCVEAFGARRQSEPGYRIIIARHAKGVDEASDRLISAVARELVLLRQIEAGQKPDDKVREQIARALAVEAATLRDEQMVKYLRGLINDQKKKLHDALESESEGEGYNFKVAQAESMKRRLTAAIGTRVLPSQTSPTMSSSSVPVGG